MLGRLTGQFGRGLGYVRGYLLRFGVARTPMDISPHNDIERGRGQGKGDGHDEHSDDLEQRNGAFGDVHGAVQGVGPPLSNQRWDGNFWFAAVGASAVDRECTILAAHSLWNGGGVGHLRVPHA